MKALIISNYIKSWKQSCTSEKFEVHLDVEFSISIRTQLVNGNSVEINYGRMTMIFKYETKGLLTINKSSENILIEHYEALDSSKITIDDDISILIDYANADKVIVCIS